MDVFRLEDEQEFDETSHIERILGTYGLGDVTGDVTVACWEPGQVSPDHAHPDAVEIYFCHTGGGVMRTDDAEVELAPGAFVVHPAGEYKQYTNGAARTLLFRVRYGSDVRMASR